VSQLLLRDRGGEDAAQANDRKKKTVPANFYPDCIRPLRTAPNVTQKIQDPNNPISVKPKFKKEKNVDQREIQNSKRSSNSAAMSKTIERTRKGACTS